MSLIINFAKCILLLSASLDGTWTAPVNRGHQVASHYNPGLNNITTDAAFGQKYYISKGSNSLYEFCGDQSDDQTRVKVIKFDLSPEKPERGKEFTLSADLKLLEVVSSGDIKVSLKYGDVPIVDETLDLCDLVTQVNKKCPLKDDIPFQITQTIPAYIPSGKYSGKMKMTDQNGKELLCVNLNLEV